MARELATWEAVVQPDPEQLAEQCTCFSACDMKGLMQISGLAGASGALAVGLGAYGAHGMQGKAEKWRTAFEAANKYHLVHSAALLGVAATRRPAVSGGLFAAGLVLFSGSCYAVAFAERKDFGRLAPIGGLCFIAGWLAMAV